MGRYEELTPKARAAYEAKAQEMATEQRQQHAVCDQAERVRERGPPEQPQRGPADDDYDRDSLIIENRQLKRRAEMLLERNRQRTQFPECNR